MKVYIITSARYEECYIKEWVKYNLEIGFDKIIINDIIQKIIHIIQRIY